MCIRDRYSARGDARLSARSLEVAQSVCRLNDRAERSMMALDEVLVAAAAQGEAGYLDAVARMLPEDMVLEGDRVRWTEQTEDGRQLNCAARIDVYKRQAVADGHQIAHGHGGDDVGRQACLLYTSRCV